MNDLVSVAARFAANRHEGQSYDGGPYTIHLAAVVAVLQRFGINDPEMLAAAWLHDVVEDTDTTNEELEPMFGDRVANLVYRVTNEMGRNRRERHAKTYPKIKASTDATTLKLADRIANSEASLANRPDLLDMYKKEYAAFKNALFTAGTHDLMWAHLDTLLA